MRIESMWRVGTKITHFLKQTNHSKSEELFVFQDVCLIYEDQENKGYYIALSQPTSKVGFGRSREDAYINLIVALVCAVRRGRKREKRPYLGVESNKKIWEKLYSVHRMSNKKQFELLKKVSEVLPGCRYEEAEAIKEKPISVKVQELDETGIFELSTPIPSLSETGIFEPMNL